MAYKVAIVIVSDFDATFGAISRHSVEARGCSGAGASPMLEEGLRLRTLFQADT